MAMMMPVMAEAPPRLGRALGERLDALRRAHGWTQGQLVIKTRLDKSTIYQILAGARKDPPIGTVMRFAEAFGVTLDELVGLKPLQIPEQIAPPSEGDRLEALENRFGSLEKQFLAVTEALGQFADQQSGSRARPGDKRRRAG